MAGAAQVIIERQGQLSIHRKTAVQRLTAMSSQGLAKLSAPVVRGG